jgi:hypothetical protein
MALAPRNIGAPTGRVLVVPITPDSSTPHVYNEINQACSSRLPQVGAEEGGGSIPRDPRLLRVEGSKEVLFVQEGVAGGIVIDLRLPAGARLRSVGSNHSLKAWPSLAYPPSAPTISPS